MRLIVLWLCLLVVAAGCQPGLDNVMTPTHTPGTTGAPGSLPAVTVTVGRPGTAGDVPLQPGAPQNSTPPAGPTLPAEPSDSVPVASYITVTVQSGDTLLGFAFDYGVPMAAIQLQNALGSSTIVQVGQRLVIPPASAWEGASPFWIVHVVATGETLSEIAQAYGLTLADLQGANGLDDADLLGVGQTLVLPLRDFAEARAIAQPTPAPTAPVPTLAATAEPEAGPTQGPVEEPAAAPTAVLAVPVPPPADVAMWGRETVRIMNEVRAVHGLPPLVYNDTLAAAGQIQANDCAARGWCSHTGSDGSTIKERILSVGYQPASWAECWALRPTPQGAIDIWMDEVPPNDPHRRTLLTTWLTEIGIGVAKGEWGYYFIAEFGKPLQ